MTQNKYDLIVVGTGFASTFFLKQYLKKAPSDAKILVLERGYLYPHAERVKERRGEETPFANVNGKETDAIQNNNPAKPWMFQTAFGGGSNCWYGCTPRFLPNDFKMKSLYGIANDWPVQYDELDPYYTQAEEYMSISGPAKTPFPRNQPYPQPPHTFTAVDKIMAEKWGGLYVEQPTARSRIATPNRGVCCASATCSVCPVNAKFTIENSGLGTYDDTRVELTYGAQVLSLITTSDSVSGVQYRKNHKDLQAMAEVVALGANAIFNSHILLNSDDSNPFVGKGLGEQFGIQAIVNLKDLSCVGGSSWVSANGYMLYDGDHRKDYAACLIEANNAPYFRLERGKWRDVVSYRMIFEDLPDDRNYVATTSDPLIPAINFAGPSDYTLKAVDKMKEQLPEILSCLPVEGIEYSEPHETEAHILGTTRMGQSASDSVIDKHLIHHKYRNLFVLGSGSFTTYTPANPTLTLSALSLFAVDQSF